LKLKIRLNSPAQSQNRSDSSARQTGLPGSLPTSSLNASANIFRPPGFTSTPVPAAETRVTGLKTTKKGGWAYYVLWRSLLLVC